MNKNQVMRVITIMVEHMHTIMIVITILAVISIALNKNSHTCDHDFMWRLLFILKHITCNYKHVNIHSYMDTCTMYIANIVKIHVATQL